MHTDREAATSSSPLEQIDAIADLLDCVLRASSALENMNYIVRDDFFQRRSIGPAFLDLLRFYLDHRRSRRSKRPERVGKSPRELLSRTDHRPACVPFHGCLRRPTDRISGVLPNTSHP